MLTILKAKLLSGYPLRHGFSTRPGGLSEGEFMGLNLSFSCGDDSALVLANREMYFASLGSDVSSAVFCQQVHGNNVVEVGLNEQGRGAASFESGMPNCDGLLTAQLGIPLNIFTADCVAVLFYDPVVHVAAACHAGWPGSAAAVVDEVIRGMQRMWGSDPSRVLVAMGPSASGCCYEVDERVVDKLEDSLEQSYVRPGIAGKFMVDLRTYNTLRLVRLGVLPTNIERVGGCSICTEEYYSHRRQKGKAGRMLATIELLERS